MQASEDVTLDRDNRYQLAGALESIAAGGGTVSTHSSPLDSLSPISIYSYLILLSPTRSSPGAHICELP